MDRFMEFNQGSCLHIMRHIDASRSREKYNIDRFIEFMGTVVDRGIRHLDVSIYDPVCRCGICDPMYIGCRYYFPRQNIYNSKTLVSLTLVNIGLKYPECDVSLPCLKFMTLAKVCYDKDGPLILEKLISGCPVLEDLQLILPYSIVNENDVVLFLRVSSQTLKRCRLGFANCRNHTDFTVEIDAPRLEYLSLRNSRSDGNVVKNLSSLLMIELLYFKGGFMRDIFRDFLANISSVRHMIISGGSLEVLYFYSSSLLHLQLLPALLESCPNLKILSLLDFYFSTELISDFTNVPRCLISTLEYVEIKKRMMTDETGTIKLVNYFLENSSVLKKLTLSSKNSSITKQEAESYKKLITSAKLSLTCQVIIDIT